MFATIMPPKYRLNVSEMPLKCHQNAANGSTWMPTLDNKTEIENLSCYITQCSAQWSAPCSVQCSAQFSAQCSTQCSAQCSAQCSTQRSAQGSTKCTDRCSTACYASLLPAVLFKNFLKVQSNYCCIIRPVLFSTNISAYHH